jgi:hypothetical protein
MKADALRAIALSLPGTAEQETWGDATFRVRNKIFVILRTDGTRASIKATRDEQQALVAENPRAFYLPEYVAQHGWVGVRIAKARTEEVRELVTEAWRMTAAKRVVRAFDAASGERHACC